LAEENAEFLRFTREMIWLRRRHPALRRRRFFVGELRPGGDWGGVGVVPRSGERTGAGPFPPTGPVRPAEAGLPDERSQPADGGPAPASPVTAPALADIHWHRVEPYRPGCGHYSPARAFRT